MCFNASDLEIYLFSRINHLSRLISFAHFYTNSICFRPLSSLHFSSESPTPPPSPFFLLSYIFLLYYLYIITLRSFEMRSHEERDNLPLFDENGKINPQLMAYSRLFQKEIGDFIKQYPSMNHQYQTSLKVNDVNIVDVWDWYVVSILSNEETFKILHKEIENKDPKLYSDLHMGRATDDAIVSVYKEYFLCPSPFSFVPAQDEMSDEDDETDEGVVNKSDDEEIDDGLTVVDRLAECYHPQSKEKSNTSIGYLKQRYPSLGLISDPTVHPIHSTQFNFRPYARSILRALPNLKSETDELPEYPSLIYHFIKSCILTPYNVPSAMYLLKDYASKLEERERVFKERANTDKSEEQKMEEEKITTFRDPMEYKEKRDVELSLDSDIPELREYQKELTKEADEGNNTVIVAPTGSGKTVVAAYIIRQHIERRIDMGKGARVVIVAPTVPLVSQHGKVLYGYLKDVAYIDYIHGSFQLSETQRIDSLLSNNLIICTPQLLINCLQSVRREDRLFISDFSLLILDECHHTCEKHPYAQLMTMIRKATGDIPQVVGMTASLGIGKKGVKDVDSGVTHVKSLLARMGATSISTVVNHVEELAMQVHRPTDYIAEISRPLDGRFTSQIINFIDSIRRYVRLSLDPFTKYDAEFCLPKNLVESLGDSRKPRSSRDSRDARFTGILNDIKSRLNRMRSGQLRAQLVDAIDMILMYIKTLNMNDLLPASSALAHLTEEMLEKYKTRQSNKFLEEFFNNSRQALKEVEDSEKEKKMLAKLREELLGMNDSSRCIVFVETREICKYLCDYISGLGKKCGFVMSSKSNGSSLINQSHNDQSQTLKDFKDGKISVMVATTVANEGIDIPQCNLIVKYNMTGNVISKVQQEGRARAKDSRSILIVLNESVLERERENLAAQVKMKNILEGINKEGKKKLEMDIKDIMKLLEQEAKKEEQREKRLEEDLEMNRFDILCGKCLEYICPSYTIKTDPFTNTYYSIDPKIWNRIHVRIPNKMKSLNVNNMSFNVAEILCGQCYDGGRGHDNVIGKIYRLHSSYLPSLRLNTLRFKNPDTQEMEEEWKSGWDGVHGTKMYISKINRTDEMKTLASLKKKDDILYHKLEVRSQEIERRFVSKKRVRSNIVVDIGWDD